MKTGMCICIVTTEDRTINKSKDIKLRRFIIKLMIAYIGRLADSQEKFPIIITMLKER